VWRVLALAGAALMVVSLFLDWYTVGAGAVSDRAFPLEGWATFESTDAVMVLTAAAALLLIAIATPYRDVALMAVGALATGVIVVALVDKPNLYGLPDEVLDVSLEIGAWLGLTGALLIVGAGALSPASAPGTGPDPGGAGS
jgi:hypothetical protein